MYSEQPIKKDGGLEILLESSPERFISISIGQIGFNKAGKPDEKMLFKLGFIHFEN